MGKRIIKAPQESGINCLPDKRFSLDMEMLPNIAENMLALRARIEGGWALISRPGFSEFSDT
uniref:Uncharacterized protein n=1 Tax=Candidatus Kentrum sp. LPFa TaxID=2126335 RepID=A0A450WIM6_9GAMM|nr:MAG: hypothetical protein BECKLPF1236B_GA0070989_11042 [Candidatus Kentron sp. LPFa]